MRQRLLKQSRAWPGPQQGLGLEDTGQTGTLQKPDQPRKRLSRVEDCEFAIDRD